MYLKQFGGHVITLTCNNAARLYFYKQRFFVETGLSFFLISSLPYPSNICLICCFGLVLSFSAMISSQMTISKIIVQKVSQISA